MIVFYRMSPKPSLHEHKRPRHSFDKLRLSEMCLRSFVEGFGDIKPKVHFLLDSCDEDWGKMIKETMKWEYEIENLDCNNQNTSYLIQLDHAKDVDGYVFFQEDDYVYLKNVGKKIEDALKEFEFVSPYDHLEFYESSKYHLGPFEVDVVDGQHWRTIDFNTMTWGCHSLSLTKHWKALHKHGFWDQLTWEEMAKEKAKLWTPIPSLCTHMHSEFLSPGIDWEGRFRELDK